MEDSKLKLHILLQDHILDLDQTDKIIEKETVEKGLCVKPDNYDEMVGLGITNSEMEKYNTNKRTHNHNSKDNSNLSQLIEYTRTNNFDVITKNKLLDFINSRRFSRDRRHDSYRSDRFYEHKAVPIGRINISTNDDILKTMKEFKNLKLNNKLCVQESYGEYRAEIKMYNKKEYKESRKPKKRDKFVTPTVGFYVLYKYINNFFDACENTDVEVDILKGDENSDEYVILYPMKKFNEEFFIIVTDSSSLVKVKRFDEYVDDKKLSLNDKKILTISGGYTKINQAMINDMSNATLELQTKTSTKGKVNIIESMKNILNGIS